MLQRVGQNIPLLFIYTAANVIHAFWRSTMVTRRALTTQECLSNSWQHMQHVGSCQVAVPWQSAHWQLIKLATSSELQRCCVAYESSVLYAFSESMRIMPMLCESNISARTEGMPYTVCSCSAKVSSQKKRTRNSSPKACTSSCPVCSALLKTSSCCRHCTCTLY